MKNNPFISFLLLLFFQGFSQNNTFSPYSRYALGERVPQTFAHNLGMGGAFVALKPDSSMPVFINAGNPAAYPLIRLTTLEVGGRYKYSNLQSSSAGLRKWTTNFAYAALGFPVGGNGGASFGILPYSSVGYDTQSKSAVPSGELNYQYAGTGGINKAYLGYGIMPFKRRIARFRFRQMNRPDSVPPLSSGAFRAAYLTSKILNDLSLGFNVNYLFGNIQHTSRIVYPSSQLYNNTYLERSFVTAGFSGNFGVQTGITIDSVRTGGGKRRGLTEKTKITLGYYMSLANSLQAHSNALAYNFVYNSVGQELISDTVTYSVEQQSKVVLPLEHGFGIGFKKGERWNMVADIGVTFWNGYMAPHDAGSLQNSYRTAFGASYVPEKYAAGRHAFWRKANYRFGGGYETGHIVLNDTPVSTYYVTAGIGLPVGIGRLSSMINISLQVGQTGTTANGLLRENFARVNFGFTFCDRWFQKFRYD